MTLVAVIPAAGAGTRLKPHTDNTPKPLLAVAGKPMLAHILDRVAAARPDRIVLVIGPGAHGERLRAYAAGRPELPITCVVQESPLGLGHAILQARSAVGSAPLLVVLGDTIVEAPLDRLAAEGSWIGVKEVDDPRRFGVATVRDGRITALVEKPERPETNLAVVGLYAIRNSRLLFETLESLERAGTRTRGEIQLTDALQRMIEGGEELRPFPVKGWYDCGNTEALLDANRALLDAHAEPVSREGVVVVPPVAVDATADVRDSEIGPHASIGPGATVRRSVIRHSIVNEGATVEDMLLDHEVIGEKQVVRGSHRRLNVGDSSEVERS
ncbi:MAG: sugar phosphate nucleotidyltransferase [Candidatus Eisenbacteria bacterium]